MTELSRTLENTINSLLMPGAYLCDIKSVREVMRDDDFRRLYGHMLLHEIMPQLSAAKEQVQQVALTFSQKTELSKDAVITRLKNAVLHVKTDALPFVSVNTPCLLLGCAMMIELYSSPHDEFEQAQEVLSLFRGLSPDMTGDTLVYAVFADREFWERDIPGDDELAAALAEKITDLQILGVREAIKKTLLQKEQ